MGLKTGTVTSIITLTLNFANLGSKSSKIFDSWHARVKWVYGKAWKTLGIVWLLSILFHTFTHWYCALISSTVSGWFTSALRVHVNTEELSIINGTFCLPEEIQSFCPRALNTLFHLGVIVFASCMPKDLTERCRIVFHSELVYI